MIIPLVDLTAQYNSMREEIEAAISRTMQQGEFILGPQVKALEAEVAAYCGVKEAIGTASGTDALRLTLLASGIEPGDEVITTPFTFIATVEAILQCGARPVFSDIDPKTFNLNPTSLVSKITEKTRAILPVHLYGQPTDMDPILKLAQEHDIRVIEDCAQAMGAEYNGKKVGSLGDVGCLSFFPSKVLGACGDGGMVITNNLEISERVKMLRNHGCKEKYYHLVPGFNSRLDALQAAILRVKLRYLDRWLTQRQERARLYSRLLSRVRGIEPPHVAPYSRHIFNYYTIRVTNTQVGRDKLREHLRARGIASAVYYPLSLHLQQVCKPLGYRAGDFPESERAQGEVLSLPMYPEITGPQIERIADEIKVIMLRTPREERKREE
jgi:dTDP-4-amino-4,6-dideoxygalactose transaminase